MGKGRILNLYREYYLTCVHISACIEKIQTKASKMVTLDSMYLWMLGCW